jgi:excisionase family DNA binding protein
MEPLLSYDQMAAELGIPVRTLREWVYTGAIPYLKLGHRTVKFQRSRVEKALAKREVREVGAR